MKTRSEDVTHHLEVREREFAALHVPENPSHVKAAGCIRRW